MVVVSMTIAVSINAMGENKYKLLRSKNIDASQWKDYLGAKRTQYDIEVAADMGDEEIKMVLKQAVKDFSQRREVDAMAVRLYLEGTSSQPYATAEWTPYGDWAKAEKGKPKSIFETSITILGKRTPKSGEAKKGGLSLEQRKKIYGELSRSQDRTRRLAEQKYSSDVMKRYDYMRQLDKKYEKEICEKYNISDKQKAKIFEEGIENYWPE